MIDERSKEDLIDWYLSSHLALIPLHGIKSGRCTCRNSDCRSAGKHPVTENGLLDASDDRETVRAWYRKYPGCNWGGRPPAGNFVLDVDLRADGLTRLHAFEDDYEELPLTLTAITGSGGMHLWYRLSGPLKGKLARGIDIKSAASGYVVLPPSMHESGSPYGWHQTGKEWRVELAPRWLAQKLLPQKSDRASYTPPTGGDVSHLVNWLLTIEEGNRNHATFWAAMQALESGYDVNPIADAAVAIGLPRAEAERTVQSAASRART